MSDEAETLVPIYENGIDGPLARNEMGYLFFEPSKNEVTVIPFGHPILQVCGYESAPVAPHTSTMPIDESLIVHNEDPPLGIINKENCTPLEEDKVHNAVTEIWKANAGKWSEQDEDATLAFIKTLREPQIAKKMIDKSTRKKQVFQEIAKIMKAKGYSFGERDGGFVCSQKYRNLQSSYSNFMNHVSSTGKENKKQPPFFDELHVLFGEKHSINPVNLMDSFQRPEPSKTVANKRPNSNSLAQVEKSPKQIKMTKTAGKPPLEAGDEWEEWMADLEDSKLDDVLDDIDVEEAQRERRDFLKRKRQTQSANGENSEGKKSNSSSMFTNVHSSTKPQREKITTAQMYKLLEKTASSSNKNQEQVVSLLKEQNNQRQQLITLLGNIFQQSQQPQKE